MAKEKTIMGLFLAVLTMLWAGAAAQSSCTNVLISMSPCLNFITGNSSTPSSQCCTQLANVVRTSPQCLCEVLNGGGSSLGININQTQALALPAHIMLEAKICTLNIEHIPAEFLKLTAETDHGLIHAYCVLWKASSLP